ncbi:hypothetical protein AABB24_012073 [Solanum stoloniferum]|uniref:Uncharacterized protein n=1 Tax=Solanum stoloniferum TaxID=62892 RepID=A0ABD2U1M9_9SOLN
MPDPVSPELKQIIITASIVVDKINQKHKQENTAILALIGHVCFSNFNDSFISRKLKILEAQICKEIEAKREATTPWLQNHRDLPCQDTDHIISMPDPVSPESSSLSSLPQN